MPARMIDGDAIKCSQRLRKNVAEKWRIHYPYWLTLADHNGTMEADVDVIHGSLYAGGFMPSITVDDVRDILRAFVAADLLRLWTVDNSEWGWFVGSDKPGRLPSPAERKKYRNSQPIVPEKVRNARSTRQGVEKNSSGTLAALENDSSEPRSRYGKDGIGLVREGLAGALPPTSSDSANQGELIEQGEADVSKATSRTFLKYSHEWQQYHGLSALCPYPRFPQEKERWEALLAAHHDSGILFDAFSAWAKEQAEMGKTEEYPIGAFVQVAREYMQRISPLKTEGVRAEREKQAADIALKASTEFAKTTSTPIDRAENARQEAAAASDIFKEDE